VGVLRLHRLVIAALFGLLPLAAHARGQPGNAIVVAVMLVIVVLPLLLSAVKTVYIGCAAALCLLTGSGLWLAGQGGVIPPVLIALGVGLAFAFILFDKRPPAGG
jgi:hypothetical protein